ncbi:MAG: glutaredoxin family protein [Pirellulaceae bacterium]
METILYTRQGCCLCDEARTTLEQHGLTVQSVDIDRDPALRDKYDLLVPVVWIGGKERFRGQVNPILLRRLLEN